MTQQTNLNSAFHWFKDPRNTLSAAFFASGLAAVSSLLFINRDGNLIFTLHEQDETTTKITYHREKFHGSNSFENILSQAFLKYGRNRPEETIIIGTEGLFYNGRFNEKSIHNTTLTRTASNDEKGCGAFSYLTYRSGTAAFGVPWSKEVKGDITLCP